MARTRKRKKGEERSRKNREELERQLCYRYTQLRNFSKVAKEFNVHTEVVRRAWKKLSDDERRELAGVGMEVQEDLNDRLLIAETAAGDPFIRDIMEARISAGRELRRRFSAGQIETISDRDFASLLRLAASITAALPEDAGDKGHAGSNNTFRPLRDMVDEDINKQNQ